MRPSVPFALLAVAGLLAGCARFSPDGGMDEVAQSVGRDGPASRLVRMGEAIIASHAG